MEYTINTMDLWDEDYGVDGGIDITINLDPDTLSQQQWEDLAEWVEENFPASQEERSHGITPGSGTYTFETKEGHHAAIEDEPNSDGTMTKLQKISKVETSGFFHEAGLASFINRFTEQANSLSLVSARDLLIAATGKPVNGSRAEWRAAVGRIEHALDACSGYKGEWRGSFHAMYGPGVARLETYMGGRVLEVRSELNEWGEVEYEIKADFSKRPSFNFAHNLAYGPESRYRVFTLIDGTEIEDVHSYIRTYKAAQ